MLLLIVCPSYAMEPDQITATPNLIFIITDNNQNPEEISLADKEKQFFIKHSQTLINLLSELPEEEVYKIPLSAEIINAQDFKTLFIPFITAIINNNASAAKQLFEQKSWGEYIVPQRLQTVLKSLNPSTFITSVLKSRSTSSVQEPPIPPLFKRLNSIVAAFDFFDFINLDEYQETINKVVDAIIGQLKSDEIKQMVSHSSFKFPLYKNNNNAFSNTIHQRLLMLITEKITLTPYFVLNEPIQKFAWSPDGAFIATSSPDNTLDIWETGHYTITKTFRGHTDAITAFAWILDGTQLASTSFDNTLHIWEPANNRSVISLPLMATPISLAWSPRQQKLAIGFVDNKIHIWDPLFPTIVAPLNNSIDTITSLSWSPDGTQLASTSKDFNTITIWDAQSGKKDSTLPINATVMQKLKPLRRDMIYPFSVGVRLLAKRFTFDVEWNPNGKYIAAFDINRFTLQTFNDSNFIYVWDTRTKKKIGFLSNEQVVTKIAWSPDGNYLASGYGDGSARIAYTANTLTNPPTINLKRGTPGFTDVAWNNNGTVLACIDAYGITHLYNIESFYNFIAAIRPLNLEHMFVLAFLMQNDDFDWEHNEYISRIVKQLPEDLIEALPKELKKRILIPTHEVNVS